MKSSLYFLLLSLCLGKLSVAQSSVDSVLIKELYSMVKIDQLAATNATPPEQFSDLSLKQWNEKKDSIYKAHHMRLEQILNQHGYPGYDVLGKHHLIYSGLWYSTPIMIQSFKNEFLI